MRNVKLKFPEHNRKKNVDLRDMAQTRINNLQRIFFVYLHIFCVNKSFYPKDTEKSNNNISKNKSSLIIKEFQFRKT